MSLDKKDLQIIRHLDTNSRIPISTIARSVQLSKENVRQRISKLTAESIFKKFSLICNAAHLGYECYIIHYQYGSITIHQEQQLLDNLLTQPNTISVTQTEGEFDLIHLVYFSSAQVALQEINAFLEEFGNLIINRRVDTVTSITRSPSSFLGLEYSDQNIHLEFDQKEHYEIDELDKALLRALDNDSRTSLLSIAKREQTGASKVRYRLKNLEERGIIAGYITSFNLQTANYLSVNISVLLKNPQRAKSMEAYLTESPHTLFVYHTLGSYDFIFHAYFCTQQEFHTFLTTFRQQFQKDFIMYEVHHIISDHHKSWLPFE